MTEWHPTEQQRRSAATSLLAIAQGQVMDIDEATATFADYASASLADGIDVQLEVMRLRRAAGETIGGWKISPARSAPDERAFGYIPASRMLRSGGAIDASLIYRCALEPELALTVGRQLAGRVSPDEARAAVVAVTPAFEICSFRLPAGPNLPRAVRVGDAMSNWGLVLGEARAPDVDLAAASVLVYRDGELIGDSGPRADLHEGAFEALAYAVALLGEHGEAIDAGQHVLLGSMLPAMPVDGATGFAADFGELGCIELGTALG